MNVGLQNINRTLFAGVGGGMMKSTQEKMERQEKCASQVSFFEKQKENLKNMTCSSLEDIARKLEMFHSYEDQIAAAKKAFNNSQMSAVLDEARERGEKIAEAAEKTAPKTPEERREELAEEAAGTEEESKGMLTEIMEEMTEMMEEITEEIEEEVLEENLQEGMTQELDEEDVKSFEANEAEEEVKGLEINEAEEVKDFKINETEQGFKIDEAEEAVKDLRTNEMEEKTLVYSVMYYEKQGFPHIDYRL